MIRVRQTRRVPGDELAEAAAGQRRRAIGVPGQPHRPVRVVLGERDQPHPGRRRRAVTGRHHRDADPGGHQADDGGHLPALGGHRRGDAGPVEDLAGDLAQPQGAPHDDQPLVGQFGQTDLGAAGQRMAGRHRQPQRLVAQWQPADAPVGRARTGHGGVHGALQQQPRQVLRGLGMQGEPGVGHLALVAADEPGDQPTAQ
ncbi:hypothetical protein SCATT_53670 [Streptantibioticus cattleyicolor NRRL 8057 = DSM 46488]|uniref:Uncharacterized protein n=1 Tax=Streptantibioticus cattleyicolor (strain ATCC 35852 / DSM 46488 / JCM 4925 / NBRC 14057 / NRRL 8057) TaxID=1003195 RepID=G8X3Y3_STREN|nr:hypothetical protein SCATT_53670 [Streptantibioticus cattleyicolor NRRL 8057 = DSM 46488]